MRQINIIYFVCVQNHLRYNNLLICGIMLNPTIWGPKQVLVPPPPSSLVYPNVFFLSILLSYSLFFSQMSNPLHPHLCFFL